jgi:dTDP-4-dehydrorhamnose 3,5-epimerase
LSALLALLGNERDNVRFLPTNLEGATLLEIEPLHDQRGFFARAFCEREFAQHGLETHFVQHSISHTSARASIRGLHFQKGPASEVKLVSCQRGAIMDVIVDLRQNSPTYRQWQGFELTADTHNSLYIPKGFAHGFQTLTDNVEVHYLISAFYVPEAAAGYRYDDPAFSITWPLPVSIVSEKDLSWPDFADDQR